MELSNKQLTRISKFISLILRHKPEAINIKMDSQGWVNTNELIKGAKDSGYPLTLRVLEYIVDTDNKQRYSFNKDHSKIRANQGHSIPIDLKLTPTSPPDVLYHGTASRFIDSIFDDGIKSMNRMYVHLSEDKETAKEVGERHGNPIILLIDTKRMDEDGISFYLSNNGVWLTDSVDKKYISLIDN